MEKPNEGKSDGLEITSIGTLYNGPWDKKYWSSSRGKDRYPYPVGYQAERMHNGTTYKMEIREGLKGPLFTIMSTDGHSCSGQTPDIAWESIQKKGYPHIKLWHGKRFSCKIDGVEFFGFKNPFVRRLLRDLMANVSGTSERNSFSPSISNGASVPKHHIPCTESYQYPDLLLCLEKPQVTGKRSRIGINVKSSSMSGLKRLRPPDEAHNADVINIGQGSPMNYNDRNFSTFSASKKKHGICNGPGVLPASVNLETAVEEETNPFLAEDGMRLQSFVFSDHLKEEIILPEEEGKLIRSIAAEEAVYLSKDDELGYCSSKPVEEKGEEKSLPIDSQKVNDDDLCAPDTWDPLVDDTYESALNNPKQSPNHGQDELINVDKVVSKVLETESHPEEETGTSTSNTSSEKNDFDTVGQEITKSMMTFLLPRALPLLKTFSRKKKTTTNNSDSQIHRMRSQEEHDITDICVVASPAGTLAENCNEERKKEMTQVQSTDLGSAVPSYEHITSVVPDSLENDQCGYPVNSQLSLFSDVAEADQTTSRGTCRSELVRLPGNVDAQESSICHSETCDSKSRLCEEAHIASSEGNQNGDNLVSLSAVGRISLSEKDVCGNLAENIVPLKIHSEQKDIKTFPSCTEVAIVTNDANLLAMGSSNKMPQKEDDILTEGTGNGNVFFRLLPNVATSTSTCNAPLSESIICRNFDDLSGQETCTYTRTLLTSDNCLVGSSGHCPIKSVPSSDKAELDKHLHNFNAAKRYMNPECAASNMAPITLQNEELIWALSHNDPPDFLNPSISGVEKSQAHVNMEPLRHKEIVNYDSSISGLQNRGTNFLSNVTDNKKLKDASDFNTQPNTENNSELEGTIQLVGCYVHPMPILLVLMRNKGNEIYICVLCGLLVDKERTLFIYTAPTKGKNLGCPSFIGHASLMLPASRDDVGREIALDGSCLQFTPDGQYLVLLNSIKAPSCRERKVHCACSACTSDCFERNAVKIVQVKLGYVLVVAKLNTADVVRCVLVCEPSCLVAAEESGRLKLWVMNSSWSAPTEECYLPTSDCIPPIVELKRIPKCAALAIGHNGFGEFSLWDISRRILVSRFSVPSTSFLQFLPVSLFRWQRKGHVPTGPDTEQYINEIMDTTKMGFAKGGENHVSLPIQGEDVAIWLLVSNASDPDVQHGIQLADCQVNPVGQWRLALLVKNIVLLGSALDPRSGAIGVSSGHGIIGTCDGLVYMWELSTGTKLGNLHDFKGAQVSCIATDDSSSDAFSVAGDDGQLLVYSLPQRVSANR